MKFKTPFFGCLWWWSDFRFFVFRFLIFVFWFLVLRKSNQQDRRGRGKLPFAGNGGKVRRSGGHTGQCGHVRYETFCIVCILFFFFLQVQRGQRGPIFACLRRSFSNYEIDWSCPFFLLSPLCPKHSMGAGMSPGVHVKNQLSFIIIQHESRFSHPRCDNIERQGKPKKFYLSSRCGGTSYHLKYHFNNARSPKSGQVRPRRPASRMWSLFSAMWLTTLLAITIARPLSAVPGTDPWTGRIQRLQLQVSFSGRCQAHKSHCHLSFPKNLYV